MTFLLDLILGAIEAVIRVVTPRARTQAGKVIRSVGMVVIFAGLVVAFIWWRNR
jgi:hypothetical protein